MRMPIPLLAYGYARIHTAIKEGKGKGKSIWTAAGSYYNKQISIQPKRELA